MGNSNTNGFSNIKNKSTLLGRKDGNHSYGSCEMQYEEEPEEDDLINSRSPSFGSDFSPLVVKSTTPPSEQNCDCELIQCDYDDGYCTNDDGDGDSYYSLLKNNLAFRLYFSSLLVTNCGEWLTYIASIDLIENKLASLGSESRTAISILVLVRLLPNLFCCSLGGILADKYDRRKLMYGLEIASAWSSVLFVFAYE